jgi:hypothetical protein
MKLIFNKIRVRGFYFIAIFFFLWLTGKAYAGLPLKEVMNVMVLSEAFTSSIIALSYSETYSKKQKINWSGVLSESEWWVCVVSKLNNKKITGCYSGKLKGNPYEKEDIKVYFNGYGIWGSDPFEIKGIALLPYDKQNNDYIIMEVEQRTRLGKNSKWNWIKATELIVGGSIGATGATIATSLSGPGAIIFGIGGALGGGASAVAISDTIKEFFEQTDPPPKPIKSLPPPKDIKPGQKIQPTENRILLAVDSNLNFSVIHSNFIKTSGFVEGNMIDAKLETAGK